MYAFFFRPARLFLFRTTNFWSQVKTAGCVLALCNRPRSACLLLVKTAGCVLALCNRPLSACLLLVKTAGCVLALCNRPLSACLHCAVDRWVRVCTAQ